MEYNTLYKTFNDSISSVNLNIFIFLFFLSKMMEQILRIQFVSDLHLEMCNVSDFQPEQFVESGHADMLVLVGDIGYPEQTITAQFLQWCSENWRNVFWIPGNHEFYSSFHSLEKHTFVEKLQLMNQLCNQFHNVHFLYHRTFDIPHTRYRLVGCTLWSHIPDEKQELVARYMNDCRLIFTEKNTKATPSDMKNWFEKDVSWLRTQIRSAQDTGKELIVLTHHLPSQQLVHPKYEHHPLNCCFASSLDSMIQLPIRTWLCGHSHTSNEVNIHNVLCTLNPYGYPGEYERYFSRKKVIELRDNKTILYDGDQVLLDCFISSSKS